MNRSEIVMGAEFSKNEREYVLKVLNEKYYRTLNLDELGLINTLFKKLGKEPERMFMSLK